MHVLLFEFHRRMYISVQGNVYSGMSKNFAQAFDIKAKFNTACGKCVPQCMKIYCNLTTLFLKIVKIIMLSTWFNIFFIDSGKNISLTIGKFLLNELDQSIGDWNCTDRTFTLG